MPLYCLPSEGWAVNSGELTQALLVVGGGGFMFDDFVGDRVVVDDCCLCVCLFVIYLSVFQS